MLALTLALALLLTGFCLLLFSSDGLLIWTGLGLIFLAFLIAALKVSWALWPVYVSTVVGPWVVIAACMLISMMATVVVYLIALLVRRQ